MVYFTYCKGYNIAEVMKMLDNMRVLRRKSGLSAKQLGEKVGLAESTITTYEKGRSEPSLDVLCSIADVLDVSLDMLVRGKEKTAPIGRSIEEIAKAFKALSDEHLELLAQTALNVLAERRVKRSGAVCSFASYQLKTVFSLFLTVLITNSCYLTVWSK